MQTITVSDKKWVVGLWWQPLVSAPRKQVRELGDGTEESPYNVFATLKERKQVGVGQTDNVKADAGVPSLAGALTRVFDQHSNVLAFFRFDDGKSWLFAVKDGQILPGGDLYGEDAEVSDQFRRYSQSDVWRQVINTASTEESEEKLSECLAALTKKAPKTQPVDLSFWLHMALSQVRARPRTAIVAGVTVIVLLVGSVALYQHFAHQARLAQQQKMEQKRTELQNKLRQEGLSVEEMRNTLFPQKWKQEPNSLEIVNDCFALFESEPHQQRGWILAGIACEPDKIELVRKRASWASFTLLPPESRFQIKEPNRAVSVTDYAPAARSERDIIDKEAVSANIYELAGILDSPVELTWQKPEARRVPESERKKNGDLPKIMPSPYWTGAFSLKDVPVSFMRGAFGLDKIPGLAISKVQKADETWSIEGEMYAQ